MIWRSLLYVPANQPRFLAGAQGRGADALILDLEDSVPASRKAEARETLSAHWDQLARGPSEILVRINGGLRDAARDIEVAVRPGLRALYVAKAEDPAVLGWLAQALDALEAERGMEAGQVGLVPMLETPQAIEAAFAVARAPRVIALTLGAEDLATACGMAPSRENLGPARRRVVMAAAAAGVPALGLLETAGALAEEGRLEMVRASRAFGFSGATTVHPDGIAALNEGFLPQDAEIAWARAVIDTLAAAERDGKGAARLDDRMIDRPMQDRAARILKLAHRNDAAIMDP